MKRASPVGPEEEPRSSSPHKPPLSVPSVPPSPPEGALAHLPSASPEGPQGSLAIAVSEAQALESQREQMPSALNQTTKPHTELEVPELLASEKDGHSSCSEQVEASAENGNCMVNSALTAAGKPEPSKPAVDEAEHKAEEPTLAPDRGGESSLNVPHQDSEVASGAKKCGSAETQEEAAPSPSQVDSGSVSGSVCSCLPWVTAALPPPCLLAMQTCFRKESAGFSLELICFFCCS